MTDSASPGVLVTGVGGPAGRAVAGYLRERVFEVLTADMRPVPGEPGLRKLPAAADPAFSEALLRALEEKRIRLLVPTVTEELPKVAEDRDAIRRRGCAVFIGPAEAVRIANDKWETAHALATRSVDSPRSYCGDSRQELLDLIPLPILSKPRLGRGGRGIEVYESADEVPERLSRERVYQEFLPGEEYDVNLFAGSGGRPRVTVVLRKTALKSGRVGNALAVERVTERDVAKLAERAVQTLALEGPIDVDIRRAASGRPQVLEINARVGANIRSAEEVLGALIDSWENGR